MTFANLLRATRFIAYDLEGIGIIADQHIRINRVQDRLKPGFQLCGVFTRQPIDTQGHACDCIYTDAQGQPFALAAHTGDICPNRIGSITVQEFLLFHSRHLFRRRLHCPVNTRFSNPYSQGF